MWEILRKEFLALLLSQADRLRVNMFMFIPSFSLEIKNISLIFSTSVFDVFRFNGKHEIKNGYLNFPFVKNMSKKVNLPDKGKTLTLNYLLVDQMIRTSPSEFVPLTEFVKEGNSLTQLDLVANAAKGTFPAPFLPPVTVTVSKSDEQKIYLVFPLIVYDLDYSPKSIQTHENSFFTPKFFNAESIVRGGIYALMLGELGESAFAPIFSRLQNKAISPAEKASITFDINQACLLSAEDEGNVEAATEAVTSISRFVEEAIPNVELLYNLKFGKFFSGADYPKASISVSAHIVDFIAIDISSIEVIQQHLAVESVPFGGFATEFLIRTLVENGTIRLLSEIVVDKDKYNRIARKAIIRYVILPKFITEYMKTQAARFVGTYRGQDTSLVQLNLISGFSWEFSDFSFEGLPTSFSVKINGNDLAYGIIREVPELTTNWFHALIKTIQDSVEGVSDIDLNGVKRIINSVWFDGVSPELNEALAPGLVRLSDITSPEVVI